MSKSKKKPQGKIPIKPNSYYPTKAELEEEIQIDATPEELAKTLGRKVNIKYED